MLIFDENPTEETMTRARAEEAVVVIRFVTDEDDPTEEMLDEFLRSKGFDPDEAVENLAVFVSPPSETPEEFQDRVTEVFKRFVPEDHMDAIRAVMDLDEEDEEPEEWLLQYVGRVFDAWQMAHGLVNAHGRDATTQGVASRMVNRPDLDEITREDMSVEVTKVMFGILAFAGGINGKATDCLNRIVFRLLNQQLGVAQHHNEMFDAGDKTAFKCPCEEL